MTRTETLVATDKTFPLLSRVTRPFAGDGALLVLGAGADPAPEALVGLLEAAGRPLTLLTVERLLRRAGFAGSAGSTLSVPHLGDGPDVLVVGTGAGSLDDLRAAGAAARRAALQVETLVVDLGATGDGLEAVVEGLVLAGYRFRVSAADEPERGPRRIEVVAGDAEHHPFGRAVTRTRAVALARDLVNTPSLTKTPAWLAAQASKLARSGLEVTVWDVARLTQEGFGGILGVGQGSTRPPRFVRLDHRPPGATRHVVLVGKGITFDTGGLSLKPNEGMVAMKTDMGGAAAVIGAMSAVADLGVDVAVTGLVAAAENMPSGSATRPGDVLRHYGGRTVEVLNTDAEGRLVLADALAYADDVLEPDVVVDLATLTGAMPVALGKNITGMFTGSDGLARALTLAGESAGERVWRLPLVEDYRPALESPVADLRNIGDPRLKLAGGSITAALFLREFAGGRPWAHLDIAGTGRSDGDSEEITKGGTGWGVRLLLRWLEAGAPG